MAEWDPRDFPMVYWTRPPRQELRDSSEETAVAWERTRGLYSSLRYLTANESKI